MSTALNTPFSPSTDTRSPRRLTDIAVSVANVARAVASQMGRGMAYEYAAENMSQHQKLERLDRA